MSTTEIDQEKALRDQELIIQRHTLFAGGFFRDKATIRTFLESLPEGVVVIDDIGTILFINSRAEQMFGYQGMEIIGTHFSCIYPEDERNAGKPDEQLGTARDLGRVAYEGWRHRKDGSGFWADVIITALFDDNGNPRGFSIVARDITESRQAEDELRKSELKLSKILHSVPAVIGITTMRDGRFIEINEAWLETFGYQRNEVIGRTSLEIGLWENLSDRVKVVRTIEKHGSLQNFEVRFKGKTGQTLTCLYSAESIDLDGELYLLSLVRDITEWKCAEEEIKRLNASLTARASELEDANLELEAFNYTVAHDLRNPLNVVSSYCQAIKELCGDKLDEQCLHYLQETYDGTLRMNRLIEALLRFSHLTHIKPNREQVDLSAMSHEVATELKLAGPERCVTFRITDGVRADGDANLLRMVLANLLGNAYKYSATREEAIIEFGVTEIDGKTVYFVRDNGCGFKMADADKLFAPFQRLPGSEGCKGFGVGLATVERIIRRHGGRIWAEGEPDKGSSFFFTLQP